MLFFNSLAETFRITHTLVRTWDLLVRQWMYLVVAAVGTIWLRLLKLAWPSLLRHLAMNWPPPLMDFLIVWTHQVILVLMWVRQIAVLSSVEAFAYAVICYMAFCHVRGLRPKLTDCLSVPFKRLVPLVGLSLIGNIGGEFGYHFFIVPALFVSAVLTVSMPACLIEKTGPLQSIGRSFVLVRGHFWTISRLSDFGISCCKLFTA